MKSTWIIVLAVVLLGGFLYMNQSQPEPIDNPIDSNVESTMPAFEGAEVDEKMVGGDAETNDSTQEFEMDGDKFAFSVKEIRVKKGDVVKVTLNSIDMPHDFVVDELDVKSSIADPGETTTVEFTADTVGEFEYYCSVGQHRANGMIGTIVVEE